MEELLAEIQSLIKERLGDKAIATIIAIVTEDETKDTADLHLTLDGDILSIQDAAMNIMELANNSGQQENA